MNYTINLLKVIATLVVAICHCWIICNHEFGFQLQNNWQILLKTPAWGGVFIFFVVSGFLTQTSLDRYGGANPWLFYKKKIIKILIPCYVFISLVYVLVELNFSFDIGFMFRILTCTFNGTHSPMHNVGATWYVFVLMWLYALSPYLNKLLKFTESRFEGEKVKCDICLLGFIVLCGFLYRVLGRYLGLEWYTHIYASVYGNLDLFFGGFLFARIKPSLKYSFRKVVLFRRLSLSGLLSLLLVCCFCYYYGEENHPFLLSVYRYITPSIYLCLVGIILLFSDNDNSYVWFCKVVNKVSKYSFEFYLWHSVIFWIIARTCIVPDTFLRYSMVLLLGLLVTMYLSILMTRMNEGINNSLK